MRAGIGSDAQYGAVVPPIHLSTNYTFSGLGQKGPYDYSRCANPTRDLLADTLADLEGGAGAVVTSSGMAAINLVLNLLAVGDRVIAPVDCYGGSHRLFLALQRMGRLIVDFIDTSDLTAVKAALATPAKLLWLETPSNPLLRITDIRQCSQLAHAVGTQVVVDNTFLSPVWQQPLSLGADLVVHSTTKYLNGHSDVVGGAVIAADSAMQEQLAWWANCLGITGAAFDSYLTLRGVRSLHARLSAHQNNASQLAQWLAGQGSVARVYYPGLPSHPGHALAASQQSGFGAMISFELVGGLASVETLLQSLKCWTLAESLGGVESLISHTASMTHAAMDAAALSAAGISEGLLRLSVGIEAFEDLQADLSQALNRVQATV